MWTRDYNHDLSGQNTFGMKVNCSCWVEYDSASDLKEIISSEELPRPFFHIGGGSNLLFTRDFQGTVLHNAIRFIRPSYGSDSVRVEVGAGVVFDDFCDWAVSEGLWGPENLSLIPGEVGAAAVQNIGAYGVEAGDLIETVHCISLEDGRQRTFVNDRLHPEKDECRYAYRNSVFKNPPMKGRFAVTSVVFTLSREKRAVLDYAHLKSLFPDGGPETPQQVRDVIISIRREKLPDPAEKGSAGSFFKNPVVSAEHFKSIEAEFRALSGNENAPVPHYEMENGVKVPAAWLIEQCGFKGLKRGNVAVWHKQPLVLVNETGEASPEEITALENDIVAAVENRFGITLSPEVEHL